jgi:hypothetical protein
MDMLTRLIDSLELPAAARIDKRIPKRMLLGFIGSLDDKRLARIGLDEFCWLASLKPANIGVAEYVSADREYREIAVLSARLKAGGNAKRLAKAVHHTVPYPVLLFMTRTEGEDAVAADGVMVSAAHQRMARPGGKHVVLEQVVQVAISAAGADKEPDAAFLVSISLPKLPRGDMFSLYQGWLDRLIALRFARLEGRFVLPRDAGETDRRQKILAERERRERELERLRMAARGERQLSRRAELNRRIRELRTTLAKAGHEE